MLVFQLVWSHILLCVMCNRFLKQHLQAGMPDNADVETLKKEVEDLKQRNADLEGQVTQLQAEVREL